MLNLNDREWKAFKVKNIFAIEKCKCSSVSTLKQGTFPYVGATNRNNGIMSFVEKKDKWVTKGNCIVFICDGQGSVGYSIYKKEDFIGSTTLKVGRSEHLNRYTAQFLVSALDKNRQMYSYGYKRNENRLSNESIMLPTADDGQPDYAFMEQYIREREDKFKQKYRDFVNAQLETPPIPLADKTQKAFKVLDLFEYKRGNQNNMNSLADGNDMLISAKNINNGLKGFYASTNNKKGTYKGNCITLNNDGDGGVGLAYYQPYKFLLDTHVYALYPKKNISYFVMLYLSQALSKQRVCFSHGYSISQDRLKAMKIMLPVTDEGSPDYEYMEQYIKAVMFGKYKKYLEYQKCPLL